MGNGSLCEKGVRPGVSRVESVGASEMMSVFGGVGRRSTSDWSLALS